MRTCKLSLRCLAGAGLQRGLCVPFVSQAVTSYAVSPRSLCLQGHTGCAHRCRTQAQPTRESHTVQTRELQGLADDAEVEALPWPKFPEDYTAMVTHMACIEHYKRGLLGYTMERVARLKHLHWYKHQVPMEVRGNLTPYEIEFVDQYELNLKRYAQACGLGRDLTMDAAPPKSKSVQVCSARALVEASCLSPPCHQCKLPTKQVCRTDMLNRQYTPTQTVQVRVVKDHGDMMSQEGKIMLRKDSVHLLPLDEVEHLMRAGIVEYLHVGTTM